MAGSVYSVFCFFVCISFKKTLFLRRLINLCCVKFLKYQAKRRTSPRGLVCFVSSGEQLTQSVNQWMDGNWETYFQAAEATSEVWEAATSAARRSSPTERRTPRRTG